MPDYDCFPLWDMTDNEGNIDPATLPLTSDTKNRLAKWAIQYDQTLNLEDPLSSGFPNKQEEQAFEEEGLALWKCVKSELRDLYDVTYFSQEQGEILEE